MVSTESEEIAEIAQRAGAKVPFLRPYHLSKDPYGVVDVCMHVLDEYEKNDMNFTKLIILLPTSPFRSAYDIRESNRIFDEQRAGFLVFRNTLEKNATRCLKHIEPMGLFV
jgi:CMP-N-acetylneuraminic acid synthetase